MISKPRFHGTVRSREESNLTLSRSHGLTLSQRTAWSRAESKGKVGTNEFIGLDDKSAGFFECGRWEQEQTKETEKEQSDLCYLCSLLFLPTTSAIDNQTEVKVTSIRAVRLQNP